MSSYRRGESWSKPILGTSPGSQAWKLELLVARQCQICRTRHTSVQSRVIAGLAPAQRRLDVPEPGSTRAMPLGMLRAGRPMGRAATTGTQDRYTRRSSCKELKPDDLEEQWVARIYRLPVPMP